MTEQQKKNYEYNHRPDVRARRLESWHRRMSDPAYRERERARGKERFQRDKVKVYARRAVHKVRRRPYFAKYNRDRRARDPQWLMQNRLRSRMAQAIRTQAGKKSGKTYELTGCTIAELCRHIESKFVGGMSWSNRHLWQIDHIHPCSKFDLTDPVQQKKCFHWTNLQPLWAVDNIRKGAKIDSVSLTS